jgi:hypothetical protein
MIYERQMHVNKTLILAAISWRPSLSDNWTLRRSSLSVQPAQRHQTLVRFPRDRGDITVELINHLQGLGSALFRCEL